jgi:endonuclease YncB( thermonuclease family)
VLFAEGELDWQKSLNCQLLKKGLAAMQKYIEEADELPAEVNDWFDIEEEVKEKQLNIWQYGGAGSDSD